MSVIKEIKAPISPELDVFDKQFKSAFKSNVPLLNIITRYILKSKGKQLRPVLVLLTAKMNGGITGSSHIAASLIELLHTATLIHDDVVDESHERRNMFSINALWKSKIAVLMGDYLLAKGLMLSVENEEFELLKIVTKAVKEMSEGELLQIQKSRSLNITEEGYFDIIRKKTATLFAACTASGAYSSGKSGDDIEKFWSFGENLGIAFQIQDDLFDYQDKPNTGKPSGNDMDNQKFTLPLIYALQNAKASEKRHIIRLIKRSKKKKGLQSIKKFVTEKNGIEYAHQVMLEYKEKALTFLNSFPDDETKKSLVLLVEYVTTRSK